MTIVATVTGELRPGLIDGRAHGLRTDVRFLLLSAVCEWFYHVLTVPHVLSGVTASFAP
jgi:hypothetical protein